MSRNPQLYNSWGNGTAMRVSGCDFATTSIEEAKHLAKIVTEVTHNHPEGIKAAEAVAVAVYLAKATALLLCRREFSSMVDVKVTSVSK